MLLTVKERLLLLGCLPPRGDITTIKLVNDLTNEVGLSEKEHKIYDVKNVDGRVTWDDKKAKPKNIELGTVIRDVIRGALKDMDKKKALTADHIPLWDKFCDDKEK